MFFTRINEFLENKKMIIKWALTVIALFLLVSLFLGFLFGNYINMNWW